MRSRRPRCLSLASAVAIAAAMALAGPVAADPGGAEVIHIKDDCQPQGDGATFCVSFHSLIQVSTQPDGDFSYVQHVKFENVFTAPGCFDSTQGATRVHNVVKGGTNHVSHIAGKIQSTIDCVEFGLRLECLTTLHFQASNGSIRYERQETVCRDLP
jgi:hypothetical protein